MRKSTVFLIIAVIGITVWNIPDTTSIFQGQHTFYNGGAPCQKCHQNVQNILDSGQIPYPQHNAIGCQGCHTKDGNESHAAKITYCTNCHPADRHMTNYTNCNDCHVSHGGQKIGGTSHTNCEDCHTYPSDIHHLMVKEKRTLIGCTGCHPRVNGTLVVENDCLKCHGGYPFWANPTVVNLSVNNHHNFTIPAPDCSICHGTG